MALTNAERLTALPLGTPGIEISTRLASETTWPGAAPKRGDWWDKVMGLFYRLCTPTLELPMLLNFGRLSDRLCRGAQPSHVGFQLLKGMGVNTVINLRVEAPKQEARVRSLGMNYLYLPMDPIGAPTHAETLAFLEAVCDPRHGQVYFHCYHGADRTGVLAACYRIAHDGWSLTEAAAEMDRHKFHRAFQAAKLEYLLKFDGYWRSLPLEHRSLILHRA
jgi:protein tyrosine phosphatase (PTP) superfamily phosphohydrolase (DUF442 family)